MNFRPEGAVMQDRPQRHRRRRVAARPAHRPFCDGPDDRHLVLEADHAAERIAKRHGARSTGSRNGVRWYGDLARRHSQSRTFAERKLALDWIADLSTAAEKGLNPDRLTQSLADSGEAVIEFALRGLEPKTTVPYQASWRHRIVPPFGHILIHVLRTGEIDRAVTK